MLVDARFSHGLLHRSLAPPTRPGDAAAQFRCVGIPNGIAATRWRDIASLSRSRHSRTCAQGRQAARPHPVRRRDPSGESRPTHSTYRHQRLLQAVRKHRAAVLRPLPLSLIDEQPRREVDVLDPQSQRLEKSQPSSVMIAATTGCALHQRPRKQRPHFVTASTTGSFLDRAPPNDVARSREADRREHDGEKYQGTQRLRLRRRTSTLPLTARWVRNALTSSPPIEAG